MGQSGVGLEDDGQVGPLQQLLHQRGHLPGPQRAVDAHSVRSQALQGKGGGSGRTAQEGTAAGLVGHGDQHREVGVLLGSQQGSTGLLQVGHSLDGDKVGSRLHACTDHLGKQVHRVFKAQHTGGLQQLAAGTDVQSHQASSGGGLLGHGDCGGDDLLHGAAGALQLLPVGPEGIGVDDLGPGVQVGGVDVPQPVGVL